jgi:oxepin-CoA hydrolase/3-oxo-5,6-dehydrosuberyl-CoA semialdehyde dehydrogenase
MPRILSSYACDQWVAPEADLVDIRSAVDGEIIAQAGSTGIDFAAVATYARETGGAALRAVTFHQRAALLDALATHLAASKDELYELAYSTGATKRDSQLDIDAGIDLLVAYAAFGRDRLPDGRFLIDEHRLDAVANGDATSLHMLTPLAGIAVHATAIHFPVRTTLAAFAAAFLVGVPVVTLPAMETAPVTEALVRAIVASGLLPAGSLQFIAGSIGDLPDYLTAQDVVLVAGPSETGEQLRGHPGILKRGARLITDAGALNVAVLGPDAVEGTPEFDRFIEDVVRGMTVKAGQTDTAVRRLIVPRDLVTDVGGYLSAALAKVTVGDPRNEANLMGPLVSSAQRDDVRSAVEDLVSEADVVFGDPAHGHGAGAFFSPVLLRARDSRRARKVHTIDPGGPVATVLAYDTIEDAITLVARGEGSVIASVFTHDPAVASALVLGIAPYHGRVRVIDRDCAPALFQEEFCGLRGIRTYMQRSTLQASPAHLAALAAVGKR